MVVFNLHLASSLAFGSWFAYLRVVLSLSFLCCLIGCDSSGLGKMVPIKGEVIYQGETLKKGRVVYLPRDSGSTRQATGTIKPDGTFVLTTLKGGDGAMYGEYDIVVFVSAVNAASNASREEIKAATRNQGRQRPAIPERYSNEATSGLSDTVDGDHSGFKRIELSD